MNAARSVHALEQRVNDLERERALRNAEHAEHMLDLTRLINRLRMQLARARELDRADDTSVIDLLHRRKAGH